MPNVRPCQSTLAATCGHAVAGLIPGTVIRRVTHQNLSATLRSIHLFIINAVESAILKHMKTPRSYFTNSGAFLTIEEGIDLFDYVFITMPNQHTRRNIHFLRETPRIIDPRRPMR